VTSTTVSENRATYVVRLDKSACVKANRGWVPHFVLLAMIWGASFLFIKVGVRELHPLYVAFGRIAAGALVLLVVLAVTRDRLPRDPRLWAHLTVVAAVANVVPFSLFAFGEERISSVLAGIWNATTPLVALPVAVLVFRTERMTARRALGVALGFAGVLVLLGVWRGVGGAQLTGQLMCLGAAACYGVSIPYQRRFVTHRSESGVALAATQLLLATAEMAVLTPLFAGAPPAPTSLSADVVGSVLALGALGTGLAYVLLFRVIRGAGATTASTVTYLIPLFATLIGVLVLGEHLTWYEPVGGLVVLVGVAVSQNARLRLRWPVRVRRPRVSVTEPS
jgi:drug/metabolite transporter (DMT)-like permease